MIAENSIFLACIKWVPSWNKLLITV